MQQQHHPPHVAIDFSTRDEEKEEEMVAINLEDDEDQPRNDNGRFISPRQYLDTVYEHFLLRVSPRPRKCDLLQDTFTVQLTTEDDYGRVLEVEMVRWMTCTHVLKDVLMHNYNHGNLPVYRASDGCVRIHDGDVRGVPMAGFPDSDVRMVADLVWETLFLHDYALYNDDGSLLVQPVVGEDEEEKEEGKRAIIITTHEKSDKRN